MIQTREEFKSWVDTEMSDIGSFADSPVWIPENNLSGRCEWFVHLGQLKISGPVAKDNYWSWCRANLKGEVRCFYLDSDNDRECWGFTRYDDIPLWILRWGR